RGERRGGEDQEARDERPAAAEQVGRAASEQQETAEDQRVARDRPADSRAAQLQVGGDVRESDVHGRDVEDDHELGDEQYREKPAVRPGAGVLAAECGLALGVLWVLVHASSSKSDAAV